MMRHPRHRFLSQALIGLFAALFLSPAAAPLDPTHNAQRYAVQSWNTENGLPQNSVHTMLQTADGYLWMGTVDESSEQLVIAGCQKVVAPLGGAIAFAANGNLAFVAYDLHEFNTRPRTTFRHPNPQRLF